MSRSAFRGPKLPQVLLDQVGDGRRHKDPLGWPHKDRRRQDTQRHNHTGGRSIARGSTPKRTISKAIGDNHGASEGSIDRELPSHKRRKVEPSANAVDGQRPKSILKKTTNGVASSESDETEEEIGNGAAPEMNARASSPHVSQRAAKAGLQDDDDEIAALERRLGVRRKSKTKTATESELDWLVKGSDSEEEIEGLQGSTLRTAEDDAWLQQKRRRTTSGATRKVRAVSSDDGTEEDQRENFKGSADDSSDEQFGSGEDDDIHSEDDDDDAELEDFDTSVDGKASNHIASEPSKKGRENPYVPPVAKSPYAPAKYVPPSLRRPAASDEDALRHLRRQCQGQLNRLSDANILSILQAIEAIYLDNPRQHVTSTVIDLLVGLVAAPALLNETFVILHAGFAAALYKIMGPDFGAQLLERVVDEFDKHFERRTQDSERKQALNLIGLLSNLYVLQVVGSNAMFDYIRLFLNELSESTTELLLRIVRTCGQQLRQEDPGSLKDIVLLLHRSVAALGGEQNLSIRTKFMIETINNVKNNRVKTGVSASQLAAEHTARMRKTLGSLNSRAKANEPLRVSLSELRDSEKKGKWWLVGASFHDPAKMASASNASPPPPTRRDDADAGYESETPNNPANLQRLAKQQGMNTDLRRAIFVSMLSASDYMDAYARLMKLHLKAKQELEIPTVLLYCAGAEQVYNPYYTLIARKLCGEKRMQKAFRFALLEALRRLGADDGDEADSSGSEWTFKKIVNLAKLHGVLMLDGCVSIAVLKNLEFTLLSARPQMFVQVLLTGLFLEAQKRVQKRGGRTDFDAMVKGVFEQGGTAPRMIKGLQYFIDTFVVRADVCNGDTEKRAVERGCRVAREVLGQIGDAGRDLGGDSDYDESE